MSMTRGTRSVVPFGAAGVVVTLIMSGCSEPVESRLPTSSQPTPLTNPTPLPTPPTGRTFVWVVVISESGACVSGATVEIVRGQGLGRKLTQADHCSVWDPDYDAIFDDVIPGEALTLRASAPGYTSVERTVVPIRGGQSAVEFLLSRVA